MVKSEFKNYIMNRIMDESKPLYFSIKFIKNDNIQKNELTEIVYHNVISETEVSTYIYSIEGYATKTINLTIKNEFNKKYEKENHIINPLSVEDVIHYIDKLPDIDMVISLIIGINAADANDYYYTAALELTLSEYEIDDMRVEELEDRVKISLLA